MAGVGASEGRLGPAGAAALLGLDGAAAVAKFSAVTPLHDDTTAWPILALLTALVLLALLLDGCVRSGQVCVGVTAGSAEPTRPTPWASACAEVSR